MSDGSSRAGKRSHAKKLRILLADDHPILRQGLRVLIDSQPDMEVVAEATNGAETVEKARACSPDVVIMDIGMPETNGAEAAESLKHETPGTKILALTVHEDPGYLTQMLKAGASGYVLKRAAADELIEAIRAVAAGGRYLDPSLTARFAMNQFGRQEADAGQAHPPLSKREQDVMRLIAWGYTNKEIAAALRISVKTVETYKARLMVKLDLRSRVDIVRYALRQGWLDEEAPEL
jgi:two-component system, NarL family, response regulator NreC